MGVLNVTPDSFSDGGRFGRTEAAVEAGLAMAAAGADWVDVGGESTRPGAEPVPLEEELARTIPVVLALAAEGVRTSIDTMKPQVAAEALAAGAAMVNDVTALRAPAMREVCAAARCEVCLMHMQSEPRTMQLEPKYGDVVEEVRTFLLAAAALAEQEGVARQRIWLDPGIGFGKTLEHNLQLLRHLDRLVAAGYPVLIGASRKSFIGALTGAGTANRLPGTIAAHVLAQAGGVRMVRVHDVAEARQAADVAAAILRA
jgi:dihydropteroate synthase